MPEKLFLAGHFDDVEAELGLDRADNLADFFGKSDLSQTREPSCPCRTSRGLPRSFLRGRMRTALQLQRNLRRQQVVS